MKKIIAFLCLVFLTLSLFFYACGHETEYTVKYDADGGTLSFDETTVSYGDAITLPEGSKAGYKLVCFIYEYAGEEYIFGQENFLFRTDITVKAVWAPENAFLINYTLDGGFFENKGVYYYFENDDDFTLPLPVKRGYRFNGYKENGEGDPVKETVIVKGSNGDKSFVADFTQAEYSVRLVLTCETESGIKEGYKERVNCTYQGLTEKTLTVSYGYPLEIDQATPYSTDYIFLCWRYYDKNDELKRFYAYGEEGAIIFNDDNFTFGEEVVLYAYCVPTTSVYV